MLTAWGIRNFLIRNPKPKVVRLTTGSKVEEIRPSHSRSFRKMGETIAAVMPDLIEVLDEQGILLRAVRPQIEPDITSDQPEVPDLLRNDPETARLTHFANLLAKAYEHTTNVAFTKLLELVERMDQRTDNIEARLERTEVAHRKVLNQQLRDAFAEADAISGDDEGGEFIRTFLQAAAQAGQPATKPTNGKGE
jgi:hypothetical protein